MTPEVKAADPVRRQLFSEAMSCCSAMAPLRPPPPKSPMDLEKQQFDHLESTYCLAKQHMKRLSAPEKSTYASKSSS